MMMMMMAFNLGLRPPKTASFCSFVAAHFFNCVTVFVGNICNASLPIRFSTQKIKLLVQADRTDNEMSLKGAEAKWRTKKKKTRHEPIEDALHDLCFQACGR